MSTTTRWLGKGFGFPVRPNDAALLPVAEGPEKVRQSIRIILDTDPGERVMRPSFGCGLRRYLMKPNTVAIRSLIADDVRRALDSFEPRIRVESVSVTPGEDPSEVLIAIAYVHARDGRPGNLVYPFSLE
jgi:phage baseplate assembly protein W